MGLLWIVASPLSVSAHDATITGFQMSSCNPHVCTRVLSPRVLQGQFGIMTMEEVKVIRQVGTQQLVIEGSDGVLNWNEETLTIRQVYRGPAKDVLIYLESGRVLLF